MKTGEKAFIVGLIVVGIILLVMIFNKNNNKKGEVTNNNQTQTQNVVQNTTVQNSTEENKVEEKYVQNLPDGSKLNTSTKLNKDKKLGNLIITNIQFKEENGITTLFADVENKTDKKTEKKRVKVTVLDEKGSKITELRGIIDPIEAKGKVQLNMGVTIDVSNAYDFEISEE